MAVIGLDLGATKLAGAFFGPDGTVLKRRAVLLDNREGDDVGRLIVKHVTELRSAAAERGMEIDAVGASAPIKNDQDRIGPINTLAFVTLVWMINTTATEDLVERRVKLAVHPSHSVPGDTKAHEQLDAALRE